jgi:twitching motility protein PilT
MVGEMRDADTIAAALTAAETGHLVLSSVYAPNAVQTIARLIDIFPPGQKQQIIVQLAHSLQAIVAQQLIPRADGDGRIPAAEILLANAAIRARIGQNDLGDIQAIIEAENQAGMVSMDQSLLRLCAEGKISRLEAEKRLLHRSLPA